LPYAAQVPGEPLVPGPGLLGGLLGPGAPMRDPDARDRRGAEQAEPGIDRHQQGQREREPDDRADGGEQLLIEHAQRARVVAEHGDAVEVVGPLVVLDRGDRGLQVGHVRLEHDGGAVGEAAVDAVAHDIEQPAGGRQHSDEADRDADACAVVRGHALNEGGEPDGEERVRSGGRDRRHQGDEDESGIDPITHPERAEQSRTG